MQFCPGIEPICDELKIKQICLDDVAKKANAELMPFEFEHRAEQSDLIIDKIVEAYKERRGCVPLNLMEEHGNDHTLTGVSEGSLKSFLGGKWTPLIELLAAGEIKGIAGVVGCSNLTAGGHDVLSVELTKELISRDILVLTAGCSSGGIENCGLMTPEAAELAGPRLRAVCQKLVLALQSDVLKLLRQRLPQNLVLTFLSSRSFCLPLNGLKSRHWLTDVSDWLSVFRFTLDFLHL